jgi:DNA helicase HerA-like ATPase
MTTPARKIPIATYDPRSPRATIGIDAADLSRSVYVVGKTGTGKSTFLENLFLRSIDAGFGACVIDPHGDLAHRVLGLLPARFANRLAVLRPDHEGRPVGLNLLAATESRAAVASGLVEVFRKLWGPTFFGPRSEHLLRHAILALLETPGTTLLGLLRILVDTDYRMRIIARVTDSVVRTFWLKEFPLLGKSFAAEVTAPVLNKLGALSAPSVRRVVGQVAPRLDLRKVMDAGGVLVVDLSRIGRDAAQLLGALVVTGLVLGARARAGTPAADRHPFLLVADEFQTYTTASFVQLLAEGRKFGLCAALAHQHAAQLEDEVRAAILGNVGTLAAFALGAEDANVLAPEFLPEVTAAELTRLPAHRLALRLLRHGRVERPAICQTLPPPSVRSGRNEVLLRTSAERYGRSADLVDREIAAALGEKLPQ